MPKTIFYLLKGTILKKLKHGSCLNFIRGRLGVQWFLGARVHGYPGLDNFDNYAVGPKGLDPLGPEYSTDSLGARNPVDLVATLMPEPYKP